MIIPQALKRNENKIFIITLVLAVGLFLAEVCVSIIYREVYIDEFFASYRAYTVVIGRLVPFVNGVFAYPPLVIPTYGVAQFLFGPSFYVNRILSSLFFVGLSGLTFFLALRQAGKWPAIGAIFLLLSNPLLVSNYTTGTMYSLTMFLLLVFTICEMSKQRPRNKIIFAAILSALLVLARTNMISILVLYALYLFLMRSGIKKILAYLALTAVLVVVGYLPIIIPNPEIALGHILSPIASFGIYSQVPSSSVVGSNNIGRIVEIFSAFVREYYGILILFFTLTVMVFREQKNSILEFLRRERFYAFILIFSIGLLAIHYFYWRVVGSVYYANYFLPLVILAIAIALGRFLKNRELAVVLFVGVILLNFAVNSFRTDLFSSPTDESDLARVSRGAREVALNVAPDGKVLVFDNSLFHMFIAGFHTYDPLVNRSFLYWANDDTELVRKLGFYNIDMLIEWARDDADYILLNKESWSTLFIRSPFFGHGSEDSPDRVEELRNVIEGRYTLVESVKNVYPRKYTEGNDEGTLEIYKRKP